jgi:hypothetical protein
MEISEEMSLNELPEGCIATALSFTTPQDVGRLSVVSPMFMLAAVSDVVWERFLPRDLESILSTSPDGSRLMASAASKKELYFSLCENPVLVGNGRKVNFSSFLINSFPLNFFIDPFVFSCLKYHLIDWIAFYLIKMSSFFFIQLTS